MENRGDYAMKVAVSSSGQDTEAALDPRFGRCSFFLIIDPDDLSFDVVANASATLSGGAGIQSAHFLATKDVSAVITGNCGANAVRTLSDAGIDVYLGQTGTIKDVIHRFKHGKLTPASVANVELPPGMGQGGGRHRNQLGNPNRAKHSTTYDQDELKGLKRRVDRLTKEVKEIMERMNKID
jgi:predicted Fe-Mo cluster-binding NifX family protein